MAEERQETYHRRPPYRDVDYEREEQHHHREPPYDPRYPSRRIYGTYATEERPPYVPHPYDHSCFRPRREDYKPPATCGESGGAGCARQNQRTLTADQQNRFLNAFTQLNNMGALGPLVDIHANSVHQMHGHPRFLPWHRIYLLRLEELLQMVDPSVCLPYWNSSVDQAFPAWLTGFTPTVGLMSGPHTVTRNIGAFATLPDAAAVAALQGIGTFNTFSNRIGGDSRLRARVGGRIDGIRPHCFPPTRSSGCTTPRSIASGRIGSRRTQAWIRPSLDPQR